MNKHFSMAVVVEALANTLEEERQVTGEIYGQTCKQWTYDLAAVFVQILKCVCPNYQMNRPKFKMYWSLAKCIIPNCKMYLSKLKEKLIQLAQFTAGDG